MRNQPSSAPSSRACARTRRGPDGFEKLWSSERTASATKLRARSITALKSTVTPDTPMPQRLASRAWWAMPADAISALLGVQPKLTQEPPRWTRSISATRCPFPASPCDKGTPAWPPPMIAVSKSITHPPDAAASGNGETAGPVAMSRVDTILSE